MISSSSSFMGASFLVRRWGVMYPQCSQAGSPHLSRPTTHPLPRNTTMKAIASLLIAACAFCAGAHAQDSQATSERSALAPIRVGLHLASVHSAATYNNSNPGIYAVWQNGLVLGALRNSLGVPSAYAGYALDSGRFAGGHLSAAVTVGAITGYKWRAIDVRTERCPTPAVDPATIYSKSGSYYAALCATGKHDTVTTTTTLGFRRDVQPLLAPSIAWHATHSATVRLTYMPKLSSLGAHVVHLSVEVPL